MTTTKALPSPPSARPRLRAGLLAGAASAVLLGCLAPPPPIVVETDYGDVRADSTATASHVAHLLEGLAPRVGELLPGSQDRPVDVWVQDRLRVYRFHQRPESVRGFTLLSGEFDARRIHLKEAGQSPWYLGHELVHALIGESWAPLPGILEEGLADAIAERLAPRYRTSIRAHRLLNASAFSDGMLVSVEYDEPTPFVQPRQSRETRARVVRLHMARPVDAATASELLRTSRAELHRRWPEIPESFYGLAWVIVSRILDRHGVDGLHELCLRATAEGHALVPEDWLLDAAGLDLAAFDAPFLTSCFERSELQQAAYLRPDAFAKAAVEALAPLRGAVSGEELFRDARPSLLLPDGTRVPLGSIDPLREAVEHEWPR